jgi:hypothetical protein
MDDEYAQCGGDLVRLVATCDLRWRINPTPGDRPTLEQKWVASSHHNGTTYTEWRWREIPTWEESF